MIIEICLFLVLVLAYYVVKDRKPKGMPPGPWEIPFLGNTPPLDVKYMLGLREKYGDVVTTRMAHIRTVLIYDFQLAKEALASMDFADRPSFLNQFSLDERNLGGLIVSSGPQWQHERRFLLRNLRNLGMGRTSLEAAIHTEAEAMVEDLKTCAGKIVEETPHSLRTSSLNIIWQMVSGRRYDSNSKEVIAIFEASNDLTNKFTALMQLYFLLPKRFTDYIPRSIQVSVFKADLVEDFIEQMKNIVNKQVVECEEKLKNGTGGDDYITEYLREIKNNENDPESRFWRGSLLQNVQDLFSAGSDTVFNMLKWSVYLMVKYPDLVKEMRRQIDDVTAKGEFVSLSNKDDLPLVEAFTTEAFRYSSMVILSVQRSANKDTTINGMFIPKDTAIHAANLHIHHDSKFWESPHDFNPRRFITPEGKFRAPKEGFLAFGSGRRQCPGETLARMEYFLFTATLIQNFDIKVPEGSTLDTELIDGVGLRLPKDQPLLFEYRN